MEVLVFANPNDVSKERFFHEISKVPILSPKFVLEPENFVDNLRENMADFKVVVILAHDQDDLSFVLSLKDYFNGIKVIIVLPDNNGETVKKGLVLNPSFLTHKNGSYREVIAVLKKLSAIVPSPYNSKK